MNKIVEMIQSEFGGQSNPLIAVRSSSSQEDLEGQAGAGLYDSVLDVDVRDA